MFPQQLNETRKAKGFTAQAMADLLSVSLRTYRNYESGHSAPTLETLVRIADILGVTTDYLLCRTGFPEAPADGCPANLPEHPTGKLNP